MLSFGVGARIDTGVTRDGLDQDRIAAVARPDTRRALMSGFDGEDVIAGAEPDIEDLEVAIDDAAGQGPAADDRIPPHAETGQVILGQDTDVVGRAVAVVHVERVDLVFLVDSSVEVHGPEEVLIAHHRLAGLFRPRHRDPHHARA